MTLESKLLILSKIARILNKHNIVWAIGASTLLYIRNVVDDFNDIDIMVDEGNIPTVKELLSEIGVLKVSEASAQYRSKAFLEFYIEGVEIDIIAGFTIAHNNIEYYFPLNTNEITQTVTINNEIIPLHSITEWRKYYSLMNRLDKVQIIDDFNKKKASI